MRSAETMEQALCDVLEDVKLGKILIKTNQITEEPEV
jgi:uridine-cytidine kinase 1-like 1 isoform 1